MKSLFSAYFFHVLDLTKFVNKYKIEKVDIVTITGEASLGFFVFYYSIEEYL